MKLHISQLFFVNLIVFCVLACRETPITPEIEEEQPVTCLQGFTLTPQDSCICNSPRQTVGEFICTEIADDEYYATMQGCLVELEHVIAVGDSVWTNDNAGQLWSYIYLYNSSLMNMSRRQAKRFSIDGTADGIGFPVAAESNYISQENFAMPYFTGKIYAEDSIIGIIRYVDITDYDLIVDDDSCQVKYINAQHLE
ncbi:hypothetical protein CEQ90_14335 [Lewinellaceae bacterium SD302]|nr:hypothetical protein CEQ90_14335 [Lewinellaceae bacterium SD302]